MRLPCLFGNNGVATHVRRSKLRRFSSPFHFTDADVEDKQNSTTTKCMMRLDPLEALPVGGGYNMFSQEVRCFVALQYDWTD